MQAPPQSQKRRKPKRAVEQAETPLDIVFVSAEVAPWSKTGGLGDVIGSLPIALAARGHRVMVIAPRYSSTTPDGLLQSQLTARLVTVCLAGLTPACTKVP